MTIFGRKNMLLLGIDISSTSVKLLEIGGSKGDYRLKATPSNRCSLILSRNGIQQMFNLSARRSGAR